MALVVGFFKYVCYVHKYKYIYMKSNKQLI